MPIQVSMTIFKQPRKQIGVDSSARVTENNLKNYLEEKNLVLILFSRC